MTETILLTFHLLKNHIYHLFKKYKAPARLRLILTSLSFASQPKIQCHRHRSLRSPCNFYTAFRSPEQTFIQPSHTPHHRRVSFIPSYWDIISINLNNEYLLQHYNRRHEYHFFSVCCLHSIFLTDSVAENAKKRRETHHPKCLNCYREEVEKKKTFILCCG